MVCNHSIVGSMADNHRKPLKPMVAWHQNHRKTIEPNGFTLTIPFNGDGAFENHWNFAMVIKCGPKSPNSFDFILWMQNALGTLKLSGEFIYLLSLSSSACVRNWFMWRLRAFLGLSNGPTPLLTIVPEFGDNHWKTTDVDGWSVKKTFSGDGSVIAKPLKNHW